MSTTFIYPVIVSFIISFFFFLWQRKGSNFGKTYIKEKIGVSYTKKEVYGWFVKNYKYKKINDEGNEIVKEITAKEYDRIEGTEKIY